MSNVSIRISSHWLHVATEHLNVLSVTKELYFQCYLIWINLNSHMSLVATILDSAGLFIVLGWSYMARDHYYKYHICSFLQPFTKPVNQTKITKQNCTCSLLYSPSWWTNNHPNIQAKKVLIFITYLFHTTGILKILIATFVSYLLNALLPLQFRTSLFLIWIVEKCLLIGLSAPNTASWD